LAALFPVPSDNSTMLRRLCAAAVSAHLASAVSGGPAAVEDGLPASDIARIPCLATPLT
jgi:hypothetical protein